MRSSRIAALLLGLAGLVSPAFAQTAPPPRFQEIDANGVDVISGRYVFRMIEGSIGSGDGVVTLSRGQRNDYGRTDEWSGVLYHRTSGGTTLVYVQFGDRSETFTISGSTYTSTLANGGTLTGVSGGYTYQSSDGTTASFSSTTALGYPWIGPGCNLGDPGTCALPMSVTRPNGLAFTLNWDIVERCHEFDEQLNCISPAGYFRFDGVTSGTGYSFSFTYASDNPGLPQQGAPPPAWYQRTGATFTNNVTAPPVNPTVSYGTDSGAELITDIGGRVWRVTSSGGNITGIRRPGSSSDDITISYETGGVVSSVTRDGVTINYSRVVNGSTATTTITQVDGDPNTADPQTIIVADLSKERIASVTNPLNRTTGFQYDANSRLTRVTQPEGNYVQFTYDARGNVTETRRRNKAGTSGNDIVSTAVYPSTCTVPATCNRPTSTTDARGYTTDYVWNSTHGGLDSVTLPAPTSGGTRPQTRYTWTLTNGEYRLTEISACSSGSAPGCVGTANESRTVIGYDVQGNVNSVLRRDGTGALSATTTATWDAYGNLNTIDGPLSGAVDTTRLRYNMARQIVGVIGPDPDAPGTGLKHRALRTTYNSQGQVTRIERGTVESQSDADWTAYASLEEVQQEYDANDRPSVQRLAAGGTTHALTQTSYDGLGRVKCVAQRMNTSEFATASLPADACTLDTEGSSGPDRITRTTYDSAGQVTLVETGVGTSAAANEVATAWTDNGLVRHVTDGEGNRTTYLYDGHDRLQTVRYPHPTIGGQSSSSDAEQIGRDANGNVTSLQLRDGQSIGFGYDRLNRLTSKNLPGTELDVSYGYDLLGRMISAATSAQTLSFTFDALGRNLTQQGPLGSASYEYDVAGRRIKLTYPGTGLFVNYDYNNAGDLTAIRENNASSGAGVLATYVHDDRGRRTSLTRGNGTITTYDYDPISRLDEMVQDLADTANDLTLTFTFNPAGQVLSTFRSNDSYAFTGLVNQNITDSHNGLNQVTSTGGTSVSHDTRGNVSAIGASSYGYSSENMLTSAPGGVTLAYDPLLRLYQTSGATVIRLAYDGQSLIAEYGGSNNLLRRYVHGPGVDEPIVWYEGTGTSDRRWLHADERGSVVAASDSSGNLVGTRNRYDEYGSVQGTLTSRFGYTGQAWVPEAGLWYYRARMYNPSLGRFMQTDPIGYAAGMNLYAYVLNDPVNRRDPLGLENCDDPQTSPIEVCGRRECEPGYARSGNFCVSVGVTVVAIGTTSVTVRVPGTGQIATDPDLECSVQGRVVTCSTPGDETEQCESGPVIFGGLFGEGYIVFGGGIAGGGYYDTGTGETGLFGSGESTAVPHSGSLGYGGSFGGQLGIATNLSEFRGSYSTIGIGLGPVSVNYAFQRGDLLDPIAISAGPAVNLLPWPPLPASGHFSQGNTSTLNLLGGC